MRVSVELGMSEIGLFLYNLNIGNLAKNGPKWPHILDFIAENTSNHINFAFGGWY